MTLVNWTLIEVGKNNFWDFWTSLKPDPVGLDPSPIHHWKAHKLLYILHISDLPDGQLTCLRSVTYAKAFSLKAGTIMNCSFGYLKIFDRSLWHSSIEIQNVTLSRFVPLRLSVMMNLFWIILDKHNFSKIFRRELYTSKLSRLAKKFTLSNIYPNL